jgi:catechol 2,3-dioxygenase
MSMTGVLRPGHCLLRVLDMEAAVKHYTEVIGLDITGRDDKGRVYLKAWDELDHHSIILRQADIPGCDFIAFKVDSKATLERLARDVEKFGCKVNYLPAGELMETGERVRFQIPTGHHVELYAEKTKVGNGLGNVNPAPWPDGLHGMQPPRMDHWQIHGIELPGSVELFTKVLGFGWTERVSDGNTLMAAFLSCSTKPHDIAFIKDFELQDRFHHVAFYLNTWEEVLRAADIIGKKNVSLDIGPTRHGITRGQTIYFFDPSGNRNEVFSGGYMYYPDMPTIEWTMDELGRAIFYPIRELNERFLTVMT